MITDILEQSHPRCTCIPIVCYCSRVRLSVTPIEPCIHRALDRCGSNSLQRCYYDRVRSRFSMDVRDRCHCISCLFWPQSSCRDRPVVDAELKMDRLRRAKPHQPITLIRFWSPAFMDTTITLATIPADPALQNLQFSPDGQVILATRSALYILVHETNYSGCVVNEQTFSRRLQTSV